MMEREEEKKKGKKEAGRKFYTVLNKMKGKLVPTTKSLVTTRF